MKLNYKRTALVGLAFFSICAFWNLYDGVIPLILRDTFHMGDAMAGFIMSLDNILALVLLPVFGALSDKVGRRMPFIFYGTLAAVVFIVLLPFADRLGNITVFLIALGLVLLSMSVYRSPAVALMPDVTEKPLRSKGNAVINLMGALGGVIALVVLRVLGVAKEGERQDYLLIFAIVAALMLVSVLVLRFAINEKKLVRRMRDINYGVDEKEEAALLVRDETKQVRLAPPVKKSLLFILASIALWFMGYNAVYTAFTKYATQVWGHNLSQASTCLLIATVGAVVSYMPIGAISSRIGRKKTILMGITLLALSFGLGAYFAAEFSYALYGIFALVGFSWASINVNSYPMVVEISRFSDIGKYTGYYYTVSMSAQILTPILSGWLLENVGYHTLFPYAAIMVALSFVTMTFARHGDNKPPKRLSKLESFDVDD
ncbi:MAG: MFS transporter [Clostridiales bacterium]|jgi:MFS family permease|nr:MFS transporter [Clostridiales bacterium]